MHIDWLRILIALDLVYFPVVAGWAAWQVWRLRGYVPQVRQLEERVVMLEGLLLDAQEGNITLQKRVTQFYQQLQEQQERFELSTQQTPAGSAGGHLQAAFKLLNRGMETDELMSVCGLTRGEADLLKSLHQADRARPAA
jgi:hypothetical protein